METLETIKILNLAVQTLKDIESLSIDDDVKEQLLKKVLESVGIEKTKTRKHTPGSQEKILESLRRRGGSAIRAEIASDSGLDPNVVSSLLNKLVKSGKVEKIPLDKPPVASGRGLDPGYIYKLVGEENGNVKIIK
jgi:predicted transcriptional regulator